MTEERSFGHRLVHVALVPQEGGSSVPTFYELNKQKPIRIPQKIREAIQ